MPFSIQTEGGPTPGTRFCDRLEDYGMSWPLPDILEIPSHPEGFYEKVSESQLPPEAADHPNMGVGACYHWKLKQHTGE